MTAAAGTAYLDWFLPALFLQFPLIAMGAALRGMGDLKIPTAIQVATVVLNIALAPALIFLASGVVFVSSSVFQGMGNALPPLGSSTLRVVLFALPAYALSRGPGFQLWHLWYLSVASVTAQFCVNMWLLHREFARRLTPTTSLEAPRPIAAAET